MLPLLLLFLLFCPMMADHEWLWTAYQWWLSGSELQSGTASEVHTTYTPRAMGVMFMPLALADLRSSRSTSLSRTSVVTYSVHCIQGRVFLSYQSASWSVIACPQANEHNSHPRAKTNASIKQSVGLVDADSVVDADSAVDITQSAVPAYQQNLLDWSITLPA